MHNAKKHLHITTQLPREKHTFGCYYYLIIISSNFTEGRCLLTTVKVTFVCARAPSPSHSQFLCVFCVCFYTLLRIAPDNLCIKIQKFHFLSIACRAFVVLGAPCGKAIAAPPPPSQFMAVQFGAPTATHNERSEKQRQRARNRNTNFFCVICWIRKFCQLLLLLLCSLLALLV